MSRPVVLLSIAMCCLMAASASRLPAEMQWTSLAEPSSGRSRERAYVSFKMYAPPGLAEEFVDKWDSYIGKQASKAQGNQKIVLFRPVISNAIHYDYSEWESMEDFAHWFEGKDSQDFKHYLEDNDIKWEVEFLSRSYGSEQMNEVSRSHKSHVFSVLTTAIVKPHHAEKFIDAFQKAEEETRNENGNQAYHLRRVLNTNDKFYLYGAWTSENAWKDHLDSNHVDKLANWADDHDVVFVESPLVRLAVY